MKSNRFRRFIDRRLSSGMGIQLMVFAVVFLLTLLLLGICYRIFGVGSSVWDSLSKCLADFFGADQYIKYAYSDGEITQPSSGVKFLTLIACVIGAVVFQGLLIATITNIIHSRVDKVKNGDVRYGFSNHYVVLGYDYNVPHLIQRLSASKKNIILAVENNVNEYRELLLGALGSNAFKRITLLRVNRTNQQDIESLCICQSQRIYIIGECESDCDMRNLESFRIITEEIHAKVPCYVQIDSQPYYDLIVNYGTRNTEFFHPYNINELWARKVLVDIENQFEKLDYRSDDDNIFTHPERFVHFVVVGFSNMGEAMAKEFVLLAHYPNFFTHGLRTKITCVDPNMGELMLDFVGRHKILFQHCHYSFVRYDTIGNVSQINNDVAQDKDFLDVEFEFVETEISSPITQRMIEKWSSDEKQFLTVALCSDNEMQNYQMGYTLPESVYLHSVPVFVYKKNNNSNPVTNERFGHVQFFGAYDSDITIESQEVGLGKYVNAIYDYLYSDKEVNIGEAFYEDTDALWCKLPIDKRWSNIYNASALPYKLRSMGHRTISNVSLTEEQVDILAKVEHNRWNVEQLLVGYRSATDQEHAEIVADKTGKTKKYYKKQFVHDDIRPSDELDNPTKDKDKQLLIYLLKAIDQNKL